MMTLDEAIKHCEEVAEKNEEMCRIEELMGLGLQNAEMMKCAREHKQLAEWLKDYKRLKEKESKRKVGEWIKNNNDYFDWYECSECGYGSEGEMRYSREYDVRTNYCPKCGTQMLEVENEIN